MAANATVAMIRVVFIVLSLESVDVSDVCVTFTCLNSNA